MTVPSITDDLIAEIEEYTQMTQHERGKEQASITFEELRLLVTRLRDSERDAAKWRWIRENSQLEPDQFGALNEWLWGDGDFSYVDAAIDQAITKERTE